MLQPNRWRKAFSFGSLVHRNMHNARCAGSESAIHLSATSVNQPASAHMFITSMHLVVT